MIEPTITPATEPLSEEAMMDLRQRVYRRENVSLEEIARGIDTRRAGRRSAEQQKTAKTKKAAGKKQPVDLSEMFSASGQEVE